MIEVYKFYNVKCRISYFTHPCSDILNFIGQYIGKKSTNGDYLFLGPKYEDVPYCTNFFEQYLDHYIIKNISKHKLIQHSIYICSHSEILCL